MITLAPPWKGRRLRRPRAPYTGWHEFITPEGVDLRLKVASYIERCVAFGLDLTIMAGILIVFSLLVGAAAWKLHFGAAAQSLAAIWLIGFFALRNFYFTAFEAAPGGASPGKRVMGLRVIARNGGRLSADAVFARNAMRELEIYLPITFFMARAQGVDAGLITLGAIWSGVFLIFPLFNRDRLRLGDLAAGTMVVRAPKQVLLADLANDEATRLDGLVFTAAQLDVYGIKELQVLEQVLRTGERRSVAEVAERIRIKIGWAGPADISDRAFLFTYYTDLRARLERRLLFGHRRADKFDRS